MDTHSYLQILALLVISLGYIFSVAEAQDQTAGFVYVIRSSNNDSSSLTADLALIKSSSVFSPDIQNLSLFARCFKRVVFIHLFYHFMRTYIYTHDSIALLQLRNKRSFESPNNRFKEQKMGNS